MATTPEQREAELTVATIELVQDWKVNPPRFVREADRWFGPCIALLAAKFPIL
jgi:hypothetical protein